LSMIPTASGEIPRLTPESHSNEALIYLTGRFRPAQPLIDYMFRFLPPPRFVSSLFSSSRCSSYLVPAFRPFQRSALLAPFLLDLSSTTASRVCICERDETCCRSYRTRDDKGKAGHDDRCWLVAFNLNLGVQPRDLIAMFGDFRTAPLFLA